MLKERQGCSCRKNSRKIFGRFVLLAPKPIKAGMAKGLMIIVF
jgi:hypothetical protein